MTANLINTYTRVTQILEPFSGLQNIDENILKNAQQRGIRVHEACNAILSDVGIFETDDTIQGYIESFKKWLTDQEFIKTPSRFFCDDLKITGECDAIYKNETGFTLVDFKTPARESKTWHLQGSAYSYLAKKAGYNITKIEFVRLKKDGKSPQVYVYEENFPSFVHCLHVYELFYKDKYFENYLDYI